MTKYDLIPLLIGLNIGNTFYQLAYYVALGEMSATFIPSSALCIIGLCIVSYLIYKLKVKCFNLMAGVKE